MKKVLSILALLGASVLSSADEGMWLVNTIDRVLEKNMKSVGLKTGARVIYDEDAVSLSDAIVSLSFSCTGSMISSDGLMITNHHCAYADVFGLSTPEHNYLENGFWALRRNEEIPVKGKTVQMLRKMIDVTDEALALSSDGKDASKPMAFRKLSHLIEKRYQEMFPDNVVSLYSMYGGRKYYLAVYDEYSDVRLVAAPPVCVGAFGGDIDNWDWPQHKGDFAIYRIYTSKDGKAAGYSVDNIPYKPRKVLKVNTKGVKEGDFTMIMGYPGVTNRFSSSYEVEMMADKVLPINASLQKERMEIIRKWMNADPSVRLKYSDRFFNLSNVQEIRECEVSCLRRDGVASIYASGREKVLPKGLLDTLEASYKAVSPIRQQITYFQETSVRSGNLFRLAILAGAKNPDRKKLENFLRTVDLRLEREIFLLNVKETFENIDRKFWGKDLTLFHDRYGVCAADSIWNSSAVASSDPASITADDPLVKAVSSMKIVELNKAKDEVLGPVSLPALNRRYEACLYRHCIENGIPCYPDANSSMRLTYGRVCNLRLADALIRLPHSTTEGILEKYKPSEYEYSLKNEILDLYRKGDFGRWRDADGTMHVNFLTNNDITGGNSGSPVMNSRGELVGLAFDGNQEGLSGDYWYNPVLNRCICVDIRYVMWVLDKYAHMDYLVDEILSGK